MFDLPLPPPRQYRLPSYRTEDALRGFFQKHRNFAISIEELSDLQEAIDRVDQLAWSAGQGSQKPPEKWTRIDWRLWRSFARIDRGLVALVEKSNDISA